MEPHAAIVDWNGDIYTLYGSIQLFGFAQGMIAKSLGIPRDKLNVNGGACALGHPIGASGARLALTAAYELSRRGEGKAAVSLCGGGGQGDALLLSR